MATYITVARGALLGNTSLLQAMRTNALIAERDRTVPKGRDFVQLANLENLPLMLGPCCVQIAASAPIPTQTLTLVLIAMPGRINLMRLVPLAPTV